MGKGFYIIGLTLLGVGGYLLYSQIKKGNVNSGLLSITNPITQTPQLNLDPPKTKE